MRRLAPFVAGLLLFTSCKLRFEMDTTVEKDGSGSLAIVCAFDKEFRDAFESFGAGFEDFEGAEVESADPLEDLEKQAPEGWKGEKYKEGEFEGARFTREFSDLDDLKTAIDESQDVCSDESGGTGGAGAGNDFTVERDGDKFTVEIGTESFETPTGEGGELAPDDAFGGEENPFGELGFELTIRILMPGKVLEHNGEKDGSQITWSFTEKDLPEGTLRVVSDASKSTEEPGGGSSFPVGILVAVVLAGGIVVALILVMRKRGGVPPVAPEYPGAPAPGAPGEPPPPPPPPPPPTE